MTRNELRKLSVPELRALIIKCALSIAARRPDPLLIGEIASEVFSIGRAKREGGQNG
jgi:hypothetical protein